MPQASDELRAVWDEAKAWEYLSGKFKETHGLIRPVAGHQLTNKEWEAICYLCDEWDYSYDNQAE